MLGLLIGGPGHGDLQTLTRHQPEPWRWCRKLFDPYGFIGEEERGLRPLSFARGERPEEDVFVGIALYDWLEMVVGDTAYYAYLRPTAGVPWEDIPTSETLQMWRTTHRGLIADAVAVAAHWAALKQQDEYAYYDALEDRETAWQERLRAARKAYP